MDAPSRLKGAGLAAASSLASAASLVAMRVVTPHTDNNSLALLCSAFGVGSLSPIFFLRRRWPPMMDLMKLFVLGFFVSGLSAWLLLAGVERTSATTVGAILSINPLITLLFAKFAGQETFSISRCTGALIACAGVLASTLGEAESSSGISASWLTGVLFVAIATSIGAVYNVFYRTMLERIDPLVATAFSLSGGMTFLILLALITGNSPFPSGISVEMWLAIAFCGVVGGVVKLLLWTMALDVTDASRVAVFITFVPVMAAILELAIFGRTITPSQVTGFASIIVGITIVVRSGEPVLTGFAPRAHRPRLIRRSGHPDD